MSNLIKTDNTNISPNQSRVTEQSGAQKSLIRITKNHDLYYTAREQLHFVTNNTNRIIVHIFQIRVHLKVINMRKHDGVVILSLLATFLNAARKLYLSPSVKINSAVPFKF